MNTKFISLGIAMITLAITSCENKIDNPQPTIAITKSAETNIESSYNLLDLQPNVYHDYFKAVNNTIGFSSLKSNPLQETSLVQHVLLSDMANNSIIAINGVEVKKPFTSRELDAAAYNNLYGKTITFGVATNGIDSKTKKTVNTDNSVSMYIPELVSITNPAVKTEKQQYPLCDSKKFVIEWNADPKNKEGVVVYAEYFGYNAIPSQNQNIHILNTDYIADDNGRATLDPDLFKDIPNLAIVHIVILRGNVALKDIEGESFKFYAESHMRLPIILVTDPSALVKTY